jgi:hypothetical protein
MEEQIIWGDAAAGKDDANETRGSCVGSHVGSSTPSKRRRTSFASAVSTIGAAAPLRPTSDAAAWAAAAQLQDCLGDDDLAQAAFGRHVARWFALCGQCD